MSSRGGYGFDKASLIINKNLKMSEARAFFFSLSLPSCFSSHAAS